MVSIHEKTVSRFTSLLSRICCVPANHSYDGWNDGEPLGQLLHLFLSCQLSTWGDGCVGEPISQLLHLFLSCQLSTWGDGCVGEPISQLLYLYLSCQLSTWGGGHVGEPLSQLLHLFLSCQLSTRGGGHVGEPLNHRQGAAVAAAFKLSLEQRSTRGGGHVGEPHIRRALLLQHLSSCHQNSCLCMYKWWWS